MIIFSALKIGFAGIGIIFIVIAIGMTVSQKHKRKACTQPVSARVADMERSESYSGDGYRTVTWFPVYEYYAEGNLIRKRSPYGSSRQNVYTGQSVKLYINPDNVNEFYCEQDKSGLICGIFGAVGAVLLAVAAAVFVIEQKFRGM